MQMYRSDEREHHSGRDKVKRLLGPIQPASWAHNTEHIQTDDKDCNEAALSTIHLSELDWAERFCAITVEKRLSYNRTETSEQNG